MTTRAMQGEALKTRRRGALQKNDQTDPLAPARGIMIGSGLCLGFWAIVGALIFL